MSPPLRQYLQRTVSEATVDASWRRVSERLERKRSWSLRLTPVLAGAFTVLLVAVSAGAGYWLRGPTAAPDATATAPRSTLPDGSTIELGANAAYTLASSSEGLVQVELVRGVATFDVVKNAKRRFLVQTGDVEVEVIGTRFQVTADEGKGARVVVERGVVNVHQGAMARRLTVGESWTGAAAAEETEELEETTAPETVEPSVEPPTADGGSAAPPVVRKHKKPKHKRSVRTGAGGAKTTESTEAVADSPADELFSQTLSARGKRQWPLAASLAQDFLDQFPQDPRAGLVAFELGRILGDQLGKPREALSAYASAQRLDPKGDYSEELMVRWAETANRLGDAKTCAAQRDQYLRRYPAGRWVPVVRGLCGALPP
ncbi:MAG: FecR domain-containing protein [Myxococcaceae bacterium]|nr:FecR domain-containing protein [Myxococcaceae bacterium]